MKEVINGRIVVDHESKVPQMKKVGIIGGMGQWATDDILQRILRASVNYPVPQYGNRGYPRITVEMVSKAPMKLNLDGSYPDILEPSGELLEAAELVGKNSDFIIIGSNTAHIFKAQIEKASGKPVLSLVDLAVDQAKKRKCKRVGIMAIGVTVKHRLFQDPLIQAGIEPVLLSKELGEKMDNEGVYLIQEGILAEKTADPKEYSKATFEALESLRRQNVDGTILGCTEIPILLGSTADDPDIINPSQLLAEEVIRKALAA